MKLLAFILLNVVIKTFQETRSSLPDYFKGWPINYGTLRKEDITGDGIPDPALWLGPKNRRVWHLRDSALNTWTAVHGCGIGDSGYIGNYLNDGKWGMVCHRRTQQLFHQVIYVPGADDGTWTDLDIFGTREDVAMAADYDGDGIYDIAVWRPSNGTFYYKSSKNNKEEKTQIWGDSRYIPVSADFDYDGKTDFVVWHPDDGNWFTRLSSTGLKNVTQWGNEYDVPISGDFTGDGKSDFVIWRYSDRSWYILDSVTGKQTVEKS